jgi:hypothetical protein
MGEQCCAYSDPTFDFIYKVNCITEYLVTHGVDASRITSHSEGGIDTYTPTNANRNVIVRLFLP